MMKYELRITGECKQNLKLFIGQHWNSFRPFRKEKTLVIRIEAPDHQSDGRVPRNFISPIPQYRIARKLSH